MIVAVGWRGELDGEVILGLDVDGEPSEVVIDRPGDLVERMMAEEFADERLLPVAAMYGYCLASRGIEEPLFVDQIIAKVGPFLRSARMESLPLYELTERVTALARGCGVRGVALRERLLAEARALGEGGAAPR